jgi:hypothetical protein
VLPGACAQVLRVMEARFEARDYGAAHARGVLSFDTESVPLQQFQARAAQHLLANAAAAGAAPLPKACRPPAHAPSCCSESKAPSYLHEVPAPRRCPMRAHARVLMTTVLVLAKPLVGPSTLPELSQCWQGDHQSASAHGALSEAAAGAFSSKELMSYIGCVGVFA